MTVLVVVFFAITAFFHLAAFVAICTVALAFRRQRTRFTGLPSSSLSTAFRFDAADQMHAQTERASPSATSVSSSADGESGDSIMNCRRRLCRALHASVVLTVPTAKLAWQQIS